MARKGKRRIKPVVGGAGTLSKYVGMTKEHLIGFSCSTVFGGLLTTAIFFLTSEPTSSSEIRKNLIDITRVSVQEELSDRVASVTFDSFVSQSLDLNPANSVVAVGTATTLNGEANRFVAIFEPSRQDVFDKLVGRPGFYEIKYSAVISDVDERTVLPTEIYIEDFDRDGNKDIFINLKSVWADSTSTGLLILQKDQRDNWRMLGIPSLTDRLHSFTSGRPQNPEGMTPAAEPTIWFGNMLAAEQKPESSELPGDYTRFSVYEDIRAATHSGRKLQFSMLRHGGKVKIFDHPNAGYKHIGIASYLDDGESIQGVHRVMVTFFKIENGRLVLDSLWNWGYPMLSLGVDDIRKMDLDDFHEAGLQSHRVGATFFGYTEFAPDDSVRSLLPEPTGKVFQEN